MPRSDDGPTQRTTFNLPKELIERAKRAQAALVAIGQEGAPENLTEFFIVAAEEKIERTMAIFADYSAAAKPAKKPRS